MLSLNLGVIILDLKDIVCVAESVVAITQGRFTRPEELDVCWQARLINRFIHPDGSMASIYGMQSAMNLDGKWKVLGAFYFRCYC